MLILLLVCLCCGFFDVITKVQARNRLFRVIRNYFAISFVCICFTLYAITNVVTVNGRSFVIPLPSWLTTICSIFAASGRIFYPVYYVLMIALLSWVPKRFQCKCATGLLVVCLVLQFYDMSGIIAIKHSYFENFQTATHASALIPNSDVPYDNNFDDALWNELGQRYSKCYIVEFYRSCGYRLTLECARQNLITNYMTNNRFSDEEYKTAEEFAKHILTDLENGNLDDSTIYLVEDEETVEKLKKSLGSQVEFIPQDLFTIILPQ